MIHNVAIPRRSDEGGTTVGDVAMRMWAYLTG